MSGIDLFVWILVAVLFLAEIARRNTPQSPLD